MKPEHAVALLLIPLLTFLGAVVATWFQRVRDIFFVLMVGLAVFAQRVDVNFLSHGWYRGTTRGITISLIEILASGLLVGCWLSRQGRARRWFWPGSLGVMLVYLGYAVVSVIVSEPKLFGVFELSKMVGSLVVFLAAASYVRSRREWTLLLVALAGAVGLEGLWALKHSLYDGYARVAGTLEHPNSLSMYLCLTVPPLVAAAFAGWSRPLRWICAGAAALGSVALFLTFSRAGIPVFSVVVLGTILTCASWRLSVSRLVVRSLLVAATVALVVAVWPGIVQRFGQATFVEEYMDPTIDGRGIYLRLAQRIAADHFFGVGLNNWSFHVSRTYGAQLGFYFVDYDYIVALYGTGDEKLFGDSYLAAPAHNLAALTLGELGFPGLALFGLLWLRWFGMGAAFLPLPRADPMRVMGVGLFFGTCGIFGQSLTEWVYRQSPILFTFSILLGALASLAAVRRAAAPGRTGGEPILALEAGHPGAPVLVPALQPV